MAENKRDPVMCSQCRTPMERLKIKKYPGRWPGVLVVSGVASCLFFIGAVVGVPLLLGGIYMATANEDINHCPNCGHYFKVWIKGEGSD